MIHVSIRRLALTTAVALPLAFTAACSASSSSAAGKSTNLDSTTATGQTTAAVRAPGSSPGVSGDCAPTYVMTFCEKFSITGAATLSGTASGIPETDFNDASATCSKWVGKKPQSQDYPQLRAPQTLAGHTLQTQWKLPYQAGTVKIDRRNDSANDPYGVVESADLMIDNTNYRVSDSASTEHDSEATATITINPDGSGSITFDKMINVESKQTISGSIAWTCVDPK